MEAYPRLVGPPSSGKLINNTSLMVLEPIAEPTLFLIQAELFFSLHLSLRRTQVLAIRAVRIVAVERFGIVGMVLRGGWWQCLNETLVGRRSTVRAYSHSLCSECASKRHSACGSIVEVNWPTRWAQVNMELSSKVFGAT